MLTRRTVLAAKIEGTIGTAETLTGSEAAFNVFDAQIQTTAEFIQRQGQGHFGQIAGYVGLETGVCTFKTEVVPTGTSADPLWMSTFFPAVGLVKANGVYTPRTERPNTNVKTLTIGVYQDGVRKRICGAMGTAKLIYEVGRAIMIEWTFMGRWLNPDAQSILAPTYPTIQPLQAKSATLTIGTWTPCFSRFEIDLGNAVTIRPCITSAGGVHSYVVADRNVIGSFDPEATLINTNDLYGQWMSSTELALSLLVADGVNSFEIDCPKVQWTNPQEGDRNGLRIDTVAFQCNKDAGNDEISITYDEV